MTSRGGKKKKMQLLRLNIQLIATLRESRKNGQFLFFLPLVTSNARDFFFFKVNLLLTGAQEYIERDQVPLVMPCGYYQMLLI